MRVVSSDLVKDKVVLLRFDIDVELRQIGGRWEVAEDYRLRVGLPTLRLCLDNAEEVIILGHLGRPEGKEEPALSVEPIYNWFYQNGFKEQLTDKRLRLLENLRFEAGEDLASEEYAAKLASYGNFYVNEAFAAHHSAASTTVLPLYLPHAAGLRFAKEVETLKRIKENPKKPLVAIIGGVKVEDKYPVIKAISAFSDHILVGGLLAQKIKQQNLEIPVNVILAQSSENGLDISKESLEKFKEILKTAGTIIWAGPVGKYEDPAGILGTRVLAETIINTGAESIIGGGDTIAALNGFLDKFSFVSVGGGAMLKLLSTGTLPTIRVLE
jgi:phosphoglycerate kinase